MVCFGCKLFVKFTQRKRDPGEIRTPDTRFRKAVLYPAELRGQRARRKYDVGNAFESTASLRCCAAVLVADEIRHF